MNNRFSKKLFSSNYHITVKLIRSLDLGNGKLAGRNELEVVNGIKWSIKLTAMHAGLVYLHVLSRSFNFYRITTETTRI